MARTTRLHTCMLCEAVCGLEVELEDGRVTAVRGDRQDPFSQGHICPKAAAIPDVQDDPDRVRTPLRRTARGFEQVSWSEALAEAGERLAAVQKEHGRSAVATYLGNPTVHSHGALLAAPFFLRALGTRSRFSATSVDQLPHHVAAQQMFGHALLIPVPDVDHTRLLLVFGANPLASNGSLMTAGGIGRRLDALKARGGRLIVVDPRRTETAEAADQHVAVRPGGDAALLAGMLHVIFAEELEGPGRIASFSSGLREIEDAVAPFAPGRVAARAGVEPEVIRELARTFAGTRPAAAYGRIGTSTQVFGGLATWLLSVLNAVTDNLDREGGVMFPSPAVDLLRLAGPGGPGRARTRVRGLPSFGGELPTAALAEEIETPGEGQLRALVTFAGNPVLSSPGGRRLERALGTLEFMVSVDLHVNETTRHAHLILPTTFGLERDHHDLAFYQLAVRDAARWADAICAPPPGVREDFQVLLDLALAVRARGGGRRDLRTGIALRALRALGTRRIVDLLLRTGERRLSLGKLARAPHGLDLGALRPRLPERLRTADHRVHLAPPLLLADLARLERELSPPAPPLVVIGRRQLRSNNSWMHNSARLVKGPPRCTLLVHPEDARERGLVHGGRARMSTHTGAIEVQVEVTDAVRRGVVSLPHGWGHGRDGVQLRVAGGLPGASLNDVTDDQRVDPLSGNAALSGVPVELAAV